MKQLFLYIERTQAVLKTMSNEQAGLLFHRLLDYVDGINNPCEDNLVEGMFNILKIDIDSSIEKYEAICEKRRLAGAKGGAPKGNQNAKKNKQEVEQNNQNKQEVDLLKQNNQNKQEVDLLKQNNQNKQEVDLLKQNNQNNLNISINRSISINNNKETINSFSSTETVDMPKKKDDIDFVGLANYWNEKMQGKAISRMQKITPKRKAAVMARESEYGKESIKTVIDKTANSTFLNGGSNTGFVASFDWVFMHPNNFIKVLEGNYDNKTTFSNSGTAGPKQYQSASERVDAILGLSNNDEQGPTV